MYTILIKDDNTMEVTQATRIMQRSKLVDELWFLAAPVYNDLNLIDCTALLEYVLPISRTYCTETLVRTDDYGEHLRYSLPIDTSLTKEFGEIEIAITFLYVGTDENGDVIQRVRKIRPGVIEIEKSVSWSDVIPDEALSAIDQRIIKTDAQLKALSDISTLLKISKADNLKYDEGTSELQLMAGDIEIGDKVKVSGGGDSLEDGVPIVSFGEGEKTDDTISGEDGGIIEF